MSINQSEWVATPLPADAWREWHDRLGHSCRAPNYAPGSDGEARFARLHDVAIVDVHDSWSAGTSGTVQEADGAIRLHVVRRGSWDLDLPEHRTTRRVAAGQFLLQRFGQPPRFCTAPHTTAELALLPTESFDSLLGDRTLAGSADTPEMRLLRAHTAMVHATLADLGPAGVQAARITIIELVKAVAMGRFDDAEPRLGPALVQAAKNLAERRLADAGLGVASLARELNVSVRTLQRAFAASGESVTAYVRHRRLDRARLALAAAPTGTLSIAELAAHWQFADGSHFSRAFKQQFGRTPTEYSRHPDKSP